MRRVRGWAVVTMLLVAASLVSASAMSVLAQTESGVLGEVRVRPGVLLVAAGGNPRPATVSFDLASAADVRLRITDFDGRLVRELLEGPREPGTIERRWNGRDDAGKPVASGPYFAVATAETPAGKERVSVPLAVADSRVYGRQPGFITVLLDPGHGGPRPGATGLDGTREADLNLDIALRAAAMLEAAGINVVLTRTTDAPVNDPPIDRTRDGAIDDTDELAARTDIANPARADLYISVHNNNAVNTAVGGPSTFFSDERSFRGRSARLASIIQRQMHRGLSEFAADGWEPFDHGALTYPYYVLRDFDPPRLRRPTQMPGVLSEGMFLSNPRELRLLKRAAVRQRMAVAYYDAIASYLAQRGTHIGYELLSGPETLMAGESATYEVSVRNSGTESIRRWRLWAGAIQVPELYEGRGRPGRRVGTARIPRLDAGEEATVAIEVKAPARAGDWQIIFDARDRDGRRVSRLGAPPLQATLTVIEPPPPPSFSPQPSFSPDPDIGIEAPSPDDTDASA